MKLNAKSRKTISKVYRVKDEFAIFDLHSSSYRIGDSDLAEFTLRIGDRSHSIQADSAQLSELSRYFADLALKSKGGK